MSDDELRWQQIRARSSPAGFLNVRCRTYRYPTGAEADWDILEGGNTIAVVALTDDDQVVLAKQYRPGPGKVLLELPGGIADGDEPVANAAARELLEETGFAAATVEVVATTYLASYATHVRHAVLARGCHKVSEPKPGSDEFIRDGNHAAGGFRAAHSRWAVDGYGHGSCWAGGRRGSQTLSLPSASSLSTLARPLSMNRQLLLLRVGPVVVNANFRRHRPGRSDQPVRESTQGLG